MTIAAVLALTWTATNALRRRPWFARPRELGAPELAAYLLGPAVPSTLFGQWDDALQAVIEGAAVLAAVYVATSYGLVPLLVWAIRRSVDQIGALGTIVARGLPLLLLFTMFLFINADVWQMASQLVGVPYAATVGVFFLLGAAFVLSRVPDLTAGLNRFDDWRDIRLLVVGTPGEAFALPDSGRPAPAPLGRRQRLNVALVSVVSQALQIALVALLLTVFFVAFGLFAISPETTALWTRPDLGALATFHLGGRPIVLTEPLLRVAGFLGAFSGMYFTVVLATDTTYREAFSDDVAPQIRQALAVRVAALHCGP